MDVINNVADNYSQDPETIKYYVQKHQIGLPPDVDSWQTRIHEWFILKKDFLVNADIQNWPPQACMKLIKVAELEFSKGNFESVTMLFDCSRNNHLKEICSKNPKKNTILSGKQNNSPL